MADSYRPRTAFIYRRCEEGVSPLTGNGVGFHLVHAHRLHTQTSFQIFQNYFRNIHIPPCNTPATHSLSILQEGVRIYFPTPPCKKRHAYTLSIIQGRDGRGGEGCAVTTIELTCTVDGRDPAESPGMHLHAMCSAACVDDVPY